jgi:hypothetical protein
MKNLKGKKLYLTQQALACLLLSKDHRGQN